MRIISYNVNGIRAALKKGFIDWLNTNPADIICLQETKAQAADLLPEMHEPAGFPGFFHCAEKKGYSGVAIYSRRKPLREAVGKAEIRRAAFLCGVGLQ